MKLGACAGAVLSLLAVGAVGGQDPLADGRVIAAGRSKTDAEGRFQEIRIVQPAQDPGRAIRVERRWRERTPGDPSSAVLESDSEMAAGELLVQLKFGAKRADLERALNRVRAGVRSEIRGPQNCFVIGFDGDRIETFDEVLSFLRSQTNVVLHVEPNGLYRLDLWPNDPYMNYNPINPDLWQWGMYRIHAAEAWDYTVGSSNIVIAVLDTGVSMDTGTGIVPMNADLRNNIWRNTDEIPGNGVDDDRNGYVDDTMGYDFINEYVNGVLIDPRGSEPNDRNGHGTMVSGVAAAEGNNGISIAGVCWDCSLMTLQCAHFQGYVLDDGAIEAVYYAISNGAHVVNASWSGSWSNSLLYEAMARAAQSGIVIVASSGNDAKNNDVEPKYPACFNLSNIISVTAIDYQDVWPSFAGYGRTNVDLAAPGVSIISVMLGAADGVSMAVPHVSGAAALLMTARPNLKARPDLIRSVILDHVSRIDILTNRVASGGVLNVGSAMASDYFVEVKAKGTPAGGVWPRMQLWLDRQLWAEWMVTNATYKVYSTIVRPADLVGRRAFTVVFSNPGSRRVLYVDSILLDGVLEEAEGSGVVYDRGNAFDHVDMVPGTETLDQGGGLRVPLQPTIYVDDSNASGIEDGTVAHPYNTIQEGANAAGVGYAVSVAPGVYTEKVSLTGRSDLTLLGSGPRTIVRNATDYKFYLNYCTNLTVEGFRVRGGEEGFRVRGSTNIVIRQNVIEALSQYNYAPDPGAAFYGSHSSLRIEGNTVSNCYGGQYGGAGYFTACDLSVISNRFINCTAWNSGGGFYLNTDPYMTPRTMRFTGNFFDRNLADYSGAIDLTGYGGRVDLQIEHNVFQRSGADYGKYGGVIKLGNRASTVRIVNNVITKPFDNGYNFPTAISVPATATVYVANNIFTHNSYSIYAGFAGLVTAEYNDSYNSVYGYSSTVPGYSGAVVQGPGNISADPLFVDPNYTYDYHLQAGSPCVNAGNPDAVYNDADGSRNDMGAYGGPLY